MSLTFDLDGPAEALRSAIDNQLGASLGLKLVEQRDYFLLDWYPDLAAVCPLVQIQFRSSPIKRDQARQAFFCDLSWQIHYVNRILDTVESGRVTSAALAAIVNLFQWPWDSIPGYIRPAGITTSVVAPTNIAIEDDLTSLEIPLAHGVVEVQAAIEFWTI